MPKNTKLLGWIFLTFLLCIITGIITFTSTKKYYFKAKYLQSYMKMHNCPVSKFSGNDIYKSQWYEDYILAYVFKDIKKGFYIDVGTNNPNIQNVTKYFYDLGWTGINFEPQENHFEMLKQYREKDININKAVSDSIGEVDFIILSGGSNPSSTMDKAILEAMDKNERYAVVKVATTTLNAVLEELKIKEIDFLKIDVEGAEDKVLKGLDLKKFRPKVIVLEYSSPVDHHGYLKFEPILFENNYYLAIDDRLNRYYYSQESADNLAERFSKINKCVLLDQTSNK